MAINLTSAVTQFHWLAALIVLGGLGWYAVERQARQTVAEQTATTQHATTQPASGSVGMAPTVDGVNLASQINLSINTLKAALPATHTINQMCDKVIAIPGVGAVAKPAIDDLRARLDAVAKV
jgi:hypothetical protein